MRAVLTITVTASILLLVFRIPVQNAVFSELILGAIKCKKNLSRGLNEIMSVRVPCLHNKDNLNHVKKKKK